MVSIVNETPSLTSNPSRSALQTNRSTQNIFKKRCRSINKSKIMWGDHEEFLKSDWSNLKKSGISSKIMAYSRTCWHWKINTICHYLPKIKTNFSVFIIPNSAPTELKYCIELKNLVLFSEAKGIKNSFIHLVSKLFNVVKCTKSNSTTAWPAITFKKNKFK